MSWFYIALFAPFFFAIVNLIDDTLVRNVFKGPYFTAMIAGFFGAAPLLSLPFIHFDGITIKMAGLAITAGFLTPLYYYCYFRALEKEVPSVVVALFSLVPATLPFLAHFILGERLVHMQIIGFAIVLIASMSLAVTEVKRFKFSAALLPVLIGVVLVDCISLLSKHVYDHSSFYPAYMAFSSGMGLAGLYLLFVIYYSRSTQNIKKIKKSLKKYLWVFVIAEAFNLAAEFSGNLAVSRGPVSLVKVIEGIQPVYVLLIAFVGYPFLPKYFREAAQGQIVKKLSLMAVIVLGLFLINKAG